MIEKSLLKKGTYFEKYTISRKQTLTFSFQEAAHENEGYKPWQGHVWWSG